jgi:hypothetical protein
VSLVADGCVLNTTALLPRPTRSLSLLDLRQADPQTEGLEQAPHVIEVDVTDPSTPLQLRSWGSPTILVDGADVALGVPSGRSCRIYPGSEIDGVPPLAMIEAALRRR